MLLWQQVGSQISLALSGFWRAELVHNRDGKLFPEEIAHLRTMQDNQNPDFGDRHSEPTLIGLPAARESFAAALQRAFCTDDEIAAWQKGSEFLDPWPKTRRQMRVGSDVNSGIWKSEG